MDLYLDILPSELLLELGLYFNYRDTVLACEFLKCERVDLWLHKIRHELGYSNDFIQKYVYDGHTMKTLMPINEKYLELKARKGVDFGTEFYHNSHTLIIRSSRLKDFTLADELTTYLLKISENQNETLSYFVEDYGRALSGAIGSGNMQLAMKLFNKWPTLYGGQKAPALTQDITKGIYEKYPNGSDELLKIFGLSERDLHYDDITQGLATGGHLEKLKTLSISPHEVYLLFMAFPLKQNNIIEYYNLINLSIAADSLIVQSGALELLKYMKPQSEYTPGFLLEYGYIDEMDKYDSDLEYDFIEFTISTMLRYNHIDALDYVNRRFPNIVTEKIRQKLRDHKYIMVNLTITTFDYLFRNDIIDIESVKRLVDNQVFDKMSKYNMDALRYIEN